MTWSAETSSSASLVAHSTALLHWWERPFGSDTFMVGADFALTDGDRSALHKLFLAGLMLDHGVSPRHALRMILSRDRWGFFANRRDEIIAVILGFRFRTIVDSRL